MSDADSGVLFDPATVCDRVTQRVNELWQTAVINSIRYGPNLSDLQIPPRRILRGAWELRCALEDGVSKIRTTSGLVGEHLNRRPFINSPGVDPNLKTAETVIKNWQELFFEPQRDNIERVIAGLRMATRNAGAQDRADKLLGTLKKSTILPDHCPVRRMVEEAIDVIQVKPPPAGANSANSSRLFPGGVPSDPDIRDLVVLLDAELSKEKAERRSQRKIALEFTSETGKEYDGTKAMKLVDRIRMMRNRGKINLDWN